MQHLVIAVETNDLPLLRDIVAASMLWVGFGHLVGLCSSTFQPADDAAHFVPNALVPCVSLLIGTTLLFVG